MDDPAKLTSTDIMARTLWGESRGAGPEGMSHVANVVMNRVAHPRWWGNDTISVCKTPWQFSCWNKSDPNRAKLEAVTSDDPMFAAALRIAAQAIAGRLPDATDGADSYYAQSMMRPPAWSQRATRTFSDGWHVFCRVELPLPGTDTPAANNTGIHSQTARFTSGVVSASPPHEMSADDLNARELNRVKGA